MEPLASIRQCRERTIPPNFMKIDLLKLMLAAVFAVANGASLHAADAAATEGLKLNLPAHTLKGTPEEFASRAER